MKVDEHLVNHLAKLSSIELSPRESSSLQADLQQILSYVERLKILDLTGIDAAAYRAQTGNVVQPDTPRPGLSRDSALRNAPQTHGPFFKAPPIIER